MTRPALTAFAVGAAAALVLGSGVAVAASDSGAAADLCVAPGQPVLSARLDESGTPTCGSGRTLTRVAGQEAVDELEHALLLQSGRVDDLDARLTTLQAQANAIGSQLAAVDRRTALSLRTQSAMPAARPDGTLTDLAATITCTGGRALSGSAQLVDATLVESRVTADGTGWVFRAPSRSTSSRAGFSVVCAGATASGGGTAPGVSPG